MILTLCIVTTINVLHTDIVMLMLTAIKANETGAGNNKSRCIQSMTILILSRQNSEIAII